MSPIGASSNSNIPPFEPFADMRVIVAGGSSGIGLSCVEALLQRGAKVVVIGKPGAASPVLSDGSVPVAILQADLTNDEEASKAIQESFSKLGNHVDAVIHTVGGSARAFGDGPLADCTEEGWQAALRLNLDSAFHVLRSAVRLMRTQSPDRFGQRGSVALVGSVLAGSPSARYFGTIGYAVAKAGLEALVRHAAASHAADGIRVNMLKPGLVDTPMAARAIGNPDIAAFLRDKQPLTAGPITPEACANAILSLIDPRNVGLTGAILTLDGGWSVTDPIGFERP